MKYLPFSNFTKRNLFTRQCIGQAITELLKSGDFEHITVSDIVKKAGVSRMTFYKYYHTKNDVIKDYMQEIIAGYLETTGNHFTMSEFQDKSHIKDAILFFDKYADFLLTMSDARQYYIIVEALNDFMLKYVYPEYNGSVYELYFYAGALLNTFLKWEELGKSESVDEIVDIVISLIKRNNLSLS